MTELKLFRITGPNAVEVQASGLALERSLRTLIEQTLPTFLGVTFLASEFSTGPDHGGRMRCRRCRVNWSPHPQEPWLVLVQPGRRPRNGDTSDRRPVS